MVTLNLLNIGNYAGYHEQVLRQAVANNPWIPTTPQPKQAAWLALPTEESLYGGALGGGKSEALLMAAAMYVDRPSYRALILRKTIQELTMPDALIDRSKEWWAGTGAHFNENLHRWRFPSGAEIWFGYLKTKNDKYRYRGSAFDFIGIDELVSHREEDYTYLFGRLRKQSDEPDLVDVPIRMRSASNPPTSDEEETGWWVKLRFVDRGFPYYVPAALADNPFMEDGYMERMSRIYDPVTFQKLMQGDWSIRAEGGLFQRQWFEIVPAIPRSDWLGSARGWDFAATAPGPTNPDPDWTRGLFLFRHTSGTFYYTDMVSLRDEATEVASLVQQTAMLDPWDTDIVLEQEPGSSGKTVISAYKLLLAGRRVVAVPSAPNRGSKVSRATPLAMQAKAGNVKLLRGAWNGEFLDELARAGTGQGHDDIMDGASIGFNHVALKAPLDPQRSGMAGAFAHRGR